MPQEKKARWIKELATFIDEFKNESDRATVILAAAKMDSLLAQLLDRYFLPYTGNRDELLEGDSPLSTFSARINTCCRLGLIGQNFAKTLHLVRRIRNAFAHEVVGISLESGPHADRLNSLLLPIRNLPVFTGLRNEFIGGPSPANDFRACVALVISRLQVILEELQQVNTQPECEFILEKWHKLTNEADSTDDN